MNEHPVIIRVQSQIMEYPPVDEWTCFKAGEELKFLKYKSICNKIQEQDVAVVNCKLTDTALLSLALKLT